MDQKTFNFALKLWKVPKLGYKKVTPKQYKAVFALRQSLRLRGMAQREKKLSMKDDTIIATYSLKEDISPLGCNPFINEGLS